MRRFHAAENLLQAYEFDVCLQADSLCFSKSKSKEFFHS